MSTVTSRLDEFAGTVIDGRDALGSRLGELHGRRVALLGEPAAVARVTNRLAASAGRLTVFLDEGVWVLPLRRRSRLDTRLARTAVPATVRRRVTRALARRHLDRGVRDAWTRRQLTPRGEPTRASVVYSTSFYRALRRGDVRLVTWPVAGIVAGGIRTADGLEHHVDVIVRV